MKRCEAIIVFARLRQVGIYVHLSVCLFLILLFFGCAAPQPVIIKHQENPYWKSDAASHQQDKGDMADLLNLLKSKKVINADEADQLAKKYGIALTTVKSAAPAAPASPASDRKDNVWHRMSNWIFGAKNKTKDEASGEVKKSDKEQTENISAGAADESKKDFPEQVASAKGEEKERETNESPQGVQEQTVNGKQEEASEASGEVKKSDKESTENISADVADEFKKDFPEQVANAKGEERERETNESPQGVQEQTVNGKQEEASEASGEVKKSDKEQTENISADVADEPNKVLPEQVVSEIKEEVQKEVKKLDLAEAVPEWVKRIHFSGDIRLRYEADHYDKNNYASFANVSQMVNPSSQLTTVPLLNTTTDQDRYKYRVRVGAELQVNEYVDAVIRLSTGNTSTPVSTNDTMGDYMNKDNVLFDLAYLKWHPWNFFAFYGGRIPNPWFSTDLVWANDLNFEGFAVNVSEPIGESWRPFLTLGAFPLQQNDFVSKEKWLIAGQLGLEIKPRKNITTTIGAAYYNFQNIAGEVNNPANPNQTDWTAPLYEQKGNTMININTSGAYLLGLAAEFRELDITGNLDIGLWDSYHFVLTGDYVRNLGYDESAVSQRTGIPNYDAQNLGYRIGMSVGYPTVQEFGQWKVNAYYKYLERDAVVDAYTDSDFHLGGTDAKGWSLGVDWGLSKNFWLSARWLTADVITGPPMAIDVFQIDLNARF